MSPTAELTDRKVTVKVAGLGTFAKRNAEFKARNERMTISTAATNILDLIFLSDGKMEKGERVQNLLSQLEVLTQSIHQVAEANT